VAYNAGAEFRNAEFANTYMTSNKYTKKWLKWIIIKKEDGEMKLWTEPVPLEKYKYKPS
jgi:hypothetical protein